MSSASPCAWCADQIANGQPNDDPHEIDCGCSCLPTCEYCGAEFDDDDPDYCCREAEYDNAEDQAEYQRTAEIERSLWRNEP